MDDFLEELKIPFFEEPKDKDDLKNQLATLSIAIERCEKILQHVAIMNIGNSSNELDDYMCKYVQLTAIKNDLEKKWQKMAEG